MLTEQCFHVADTQHGTEATCVKCGGRLYRAQNRIGVYRLAVREEDTRRGFSVDSAGTIRQGGSVLCELTKEELLWTVSEAIRQHQIPAMAHPCEPMDSSWSVEVTPVESRFWLVEHRSSGSFAGPLADDELLGWFASMLYSGKAPLFAPLQTYAEYVAGRPWLTRRPVLANLAFREEILSANRIG